MKKFLVDRDAHMWGGFKLMARLSCASKSALIAVIDANAAARAMWTRGAE